mmetsp:Transcript_26474/g.51780  ORF Transcript_26474/g.51780 Transcript_26474/m.51780 type:complete len:82 (+) Transcript_26474:548-793(+)
MTDLSKLDAKHFAKQKKRSRKSIDEGPNKAGRHRGTQKGPLRHGQERRPGQKKITQKRRKRYPSNGGEALPRADHLGPILQ